MVGWLIVRFEHLHARLSHDALDSGPQKFHARPTPRIGGLVIGAGMFSGGAVAVAAGAMPREGAIWFCIAVAPAFLSGLVEDLTKRVGPDMRLWASFLSALICVYFFDAVVVRFDLPWIDALLEWYPLALLFTVVAVGGVAHAVNIVDGYNGLAGGATVMMICALGAVAGWLGDELLLGICVVLAGATCGFLFWNWPGGRVFAGDGGAYLWGVTVGMVAVLLVQRHPEVSPWFPLLVVLYPVWETLFTVWRRKFKHAAPSGAPDAKHLHQLLYRRLVRFPGWNGRFVPAAVVCRNSATAPFLWSLALVGILPALMSWRHTGWLIAFAILFVLLYGWLYHVIACFRTPRWLRSLGRWAGGCCAERGRE